MVREILRNDLDGLAGPLHDVPAAGAVNVDVNESGHHRVLLEVERQIEVLESGGTIVQETRLYDGDTKRARSMRSKEDANDYRYFPCPDLLPVIIDDATIDKIRASMPELPQARRARFIETLGLSDYDAGQLTMERAVADYFEQPPRNATMERGFFLVTVRGKQDVSFEYVVTDIEDAAANGRTLFTYVIQ